jgi:hypothetical protein
MSVNGDVTFAETNTSVGNTVSICAPNGSILDGNGAAVDVVSTNLTLNAHNDVGAASDAIETDVTAMTANATTGSITTNELDTTTHDGITVGLTLSTACGTSQMSGINAGTDVNINSTDGDLNIGNINSGGTTTLTTDNGAVLNVLPGTINIQSGGNVTIAAEGGTVGTPGLPRRLKARCREGCLYRGPLLTLLLELGLYIKCRRGKNKHGQYS